MKIAVLAGAFALAAITFAGADAVERVTNGGFETGTGTAAPPWSFTDAQACTVATCVLSPATGARYASSGLNFETAPPSTIGHSLGSFSQSVTLPEEPITVKFSARAIDSQRPVDTYLTIFLNGTNQGTYLSSDHLSTNFAAFSFSLAPGGSSPSPTTLEFRISCNNPGTSTEDCDRIDVDDVSIVTGSPPGAPTISGTTPSSPGGDQTPLVRGTLGPGNADQVRIHRGTTCSDPVGIGSAADFTGAGIEALAMENATTTFTAEAMNLAGYSPCSNPFTYTHVGPAVDKDPPTLRLVGAKTQILSKTVRVKPLCSNEPCRATGTGKLVVRYRVRGQRRKVTFALKRATRQLPAATLRPLRLGVSRAARKAARRALRRGGSAVANVAVLAADAAGNTTTRRQAVKLLLPE